MLYIVSTPIGNLQDISLRAIDVLKNCDYILCEDTRQSAKLTAHYEIGTKLASFHLFNEKAKNESIIHDLHAGKKIALISDAGTPLIADPGESLVAACHKEGIQVTGIPGPCALIMALTLSGFSSLPFQFVGFLPKKEGEKATLFENLLAYTGTSLCYESPHRIEETLTLLHKLAPTRKLAIARELTKQYETVAIGTAEELMKIPLLGEIVLLIEGQKEQASTAFSTKLLHDCVHDLVAQGQSVKDAVAAVSKQLNVPRKAVYQAAHLAL